ncbi:Fructosamine kinase [Methyloligella halotolerans]|uniref:Fructosamine kinase n=1 Tax=Methyloligella halotolerans TaxID=1177755 RepID=A0A1E2S3E1_9HYPH|nr:fructosamine kinase family protein [Methyloligella halotolerans]ODA68920.1 Fructosamine kinase [Methyloligella halotolerans]
MLKERLETVLGDEIVQSASLPVGFGLEGLEVRLRDGRHLAVKAMRSPGKTQLSNGLWAAPLKIEGYMLSELRRLSDFPVPAVHHCDADLLVMDFIETDGGRITGAVERDAAEIIAALHSVRGTRFGYPKDTVIGPLPQRNPESDRWIPFFAEHRLMAMARMAHEKGPLSTADLGRLERLAERLDEYLVKPDHPSLLHGDLWTGNVLLKGDRIAGFVDPAISFGHPEIELAFTTMFGTFGNAFFDAYEAISPLEPGFHTLRKDLYNLYPTLVHVRLFGAGYLGGIDSTLRRIGL